MIKQLVLTSAAIAAFGVAAVATAQDRPDDRGGMQADRGPRDDRGMRRDDGRHHDGMHRHHMVQRHHRHHYHHG